MEDGMVEFVYNQLLYIKEQIETLEAIVELLANLEDPGA